MPPTKHGFVRATCLYETPHGDEAAVLSTRLARKGHKAGLCFDDMIAQFRHNFRLGKFIRVFFARLIFPYLLDM